MWFVYIPSRKEINTKTNKMSLRHKDMFIPNFGGIIRSLCGFKSVNPHNSTISYFRLSTRGCIN